MNHRKMVPIVHVLFCFFLLAFSRNVFADIDWTPIKQFNLGSKPLDVTTSGDGRMVFVLTRGEIIVYSPAQNNIIRRIPLKQEFDKIEYSAGAKLLVLTSSRANLLKILRVDKIYDIDISGSPVFGPTNAPVIIVAFDDYQ